MVVRFTHPTKFSRLLTTMLRQETWTTKSVEIATKTNRNGAAKIHNDMWMCSPKKAADEILISTFLCCTKATLRAIFPFCKWNLIVVEKFSSAILNWRLEINNEEVCRGGTDGAWGRENVEISRNLRAKDENFRTRWRADSKEFSKKACEMNSSFKNSLAI